MLGHLLKQKKFLREKKDLLLKKREKLLLQTGYGPSGFPHIGTFGEVARTSMIVNALKSSYRSTKRNYYIF